MSRKKLAGPENNRVNIDLIWDPASMFVASMGSRSRPRAGEPWCFTDLGIDVGSCVVVINVADDPIFGRQTEVVIEPNAEEDSELVIFNFDDDDNEGKDDFVDICKKATVLGLIVAPDAWVVLQEKARFKGIICSENILVKKGMIAVNHTVSGERARAIGEDAYLRAVCG